MTINKEELIGDNTILYVDQVRKSYGKKRVLKNMSFSIGKDCRKIRPKWMWKDDSYKANKWANTNNRWDY